MHDLYLTSPWTLLPFLSYFQDPKPLEMPQTL